MEDEQAQVEEATEESDPTITPPQIDNLPVTEAIEEVAPKSLDFSTPPISMPSASLGKVAESPQILAPKISHESPVVMPAAPVIKPPAVVME